jgi:small conductance mechanosensitive channel
MQIGQTVASFLQWLGTSLVGQILTAAVVIIVGWHVANLAVRLLGRPVAHRFERQSLTKTILRTIKFAIVLFSVAIAIGILPLGIGFSNIFLSVTVISGVVGITLAPVVSSYLEGLFLLADRPYEIGDMIRLVDSEHIEQRGFIQDITLRHTKILARDNTVVVIPNSAIRERDVINYSIEDERTWMTLDLSVTYEGDLAEARRIMIRAAGDTDGVIDGGPTIRIGAARYPARPTCLIHEYADNGVILRLRYWMRTPHYPGRIRSEIQERIWKELDEADVEFPYPHTHLVFDETNDKSEPDVIRIG